MTAIRIDLAGDDTSRHAGGPVGWDDPCSLDDAGEILINIGPVQISMSYGQFDTWLEAIYRSRWTLRTETGPVDLCADQPPPTWEAYVQGIRSDMSTERHSIAATLTQESGNHGLHPKPPDGDKAALRWFLAGRSEGVRDGLLRAAKMATERDEWLELTEPKKEGRRRR